MRIRLLKLRFGMAGLLMVLAACSSDISGPVNVEVIHPVAGRKCEYVVGPVTLTTLSSLSSMRGALGSVVYTSDNVGSRPDILKEQKGFNAVDTEFSKSGGTYSAMDLDSLYAASLYYAVETAHLTFSRLDANADMTRLPDFAARTLIVHEAKRTFGDIGVDPEVTDNAEYFSQRVGNSDGGMGYVLNYLFSYPTVEVKDIPLGLNLGIMAHEFTHLVMRHRFYEPGIARDVGVAKGKPTMNTLAALDEGLADYFGFLASGDPSFFLCSYPNEDRDLLVPKAFTDEIITSIASGTRFDSHEGGAVFASINYEIGKQIGFEENGRALIKLMSGLLECSNTRSGTNSISFNFGDVASCHASQAPSQYQSIIRQIYSSRLGSYGGL